MSGVFGARVVPLPKTFKDINRSITLSLGLVFLLCVVFFLLLGFLGSTFSFYSFLRFRQFPIVVYGVCGFRSFPQCPELLVCVIFWLFHGFLVSSLPLSGCR